MSLVGLSKESYVSLETFRKNGQGVKTPVWVAGEGEKLYVWTQANAWKARRVRHNPQVKLAKCDARGNVQGEWISAQARVLDSPSELEKMRRRLTTKYGLIFRLFQLMGWLRANKTGYVVIEINPM